MDTTSKINYKVKDTVYFYLNGKVHQGEVTSIFEDNRLYPIHVYSYIDKICYFFTTDGYFMPRNLDIERLSFTPFEVKLEGATYERLEPEIPKDTLVWVRIDNNEWFARYYSHKKNGIYHCFVQQLKSTQTQETMAWKQISLECPLK